MRLSLVTVVAGLLASAACTGEVAPPAAAVYVVDREPGVEFTVTADALIFPAAGNEALLERTPGDVLVCPRGNGLLRKVVSVSPAGETIRVATEPATLADALDDGSFDHQVTARAGKSEPTEAKRFKGFSFGLGKLNLPTAIGLQVNVDGGHFNFDPDLDIHFQVRRHELAEVRAVASGTLDTAISADIAVDGQIDHSMFQPLWKVQHPMVQVIGGIPVVEVIELTVGVGVQIKASGHAKVHLGGTAHGTLSAGAVWDRAQGWRAVNDRALDVTSDTHVIEGQLAEMQVSALVYGELSVKLYDVVGPAIRIVPYVGIEHLAGQTGWTPKVGILGRFEAVLSLPFWTKREWVPWRTVLFDYFKTFPAEPASPPASCNGVSAQGLCSEGVAVRCDAGALRIEDCAASGLGCALSGTAVACVPGCGELDYLGGCADGNLRWCDGGQVHTYECPATGPGCGWQDATIGYNCL